MKSYPSITEEVRQDIYIYAFDKLDGSNIRAEWNSKKGFYKFGTRTQLMDEKTMPFGRAIPLIREKYEEDLTAVFKEQGWKDALCFFEFWGPSSFAGNHNFEEKMDVTLLDVNPYKEGILMPTQFIKLFGHLDIPKICYEGYVTTELFDKVKQSTLEGMTFEGVVCKSVNDKATRMPIMFKIKSKAWLEKLREYCKGDERLFEKVIMKKNDMDMWKNSQFINVLGRPEISAMNLGAPSLFKALFDKTSGHVTEFYRKGRVKGVDDNEDLANVEPLKVKYQKFFDSKAGRLIYNYLDNKSIYLWKDGIVEFTVSGNYVSVHVLSHNQKFAEEVRDYFKSQWALPDKKGHIYAIVRNGMHLGLNSIGDAGIPLVEDNYTPTVQEDYKYAINDLNSDSPSGRIVIMRGPAGTGKTHLIRAMLLQVPDAMFVLISPEVVTNLAGPELLPLLMNYRGGSTGPIVLVLEDADRCLVTRGDENMSLIQSLLNLGDGILGSMLDIRIVATTNAEELKLDKAVTRPGRLSKMLNVNTLDPLTAQRIFRRLLPDTAFPVEINGSTNPKDFNVTLAEVYALARKNGWKAAPRKVVDDIDDNDIDDNDMDDWDE